MDKVYVGLYGPDYRQIIFEYFPDFQDNLILTSAIQQNHTIFTIDNGWGLQEFLDIIQYFPECKKVLMKKGISPLIEVKDTEVIPYNPDLSGFADGKHLGLFPRLGPANLEDYQKLLALGVPCVVNVSQHRDTIKHEETGFVYGAVQWAVHWLKALVVNPTLYPKISNNLLQVAKQQKDIERQKLLPNSPALNTLDPRTAPMQPTLVATPLVTIITPTHKRDPKIISRCINCLQLQTVKDWQQLICSDGGKERHVEELLKNLNESRVKYFHSEKSTKQGDYGNTVRKEMLKLATGKYVFFYDDDNLIDPTYLEKTIRAIETAKADFAVSQIVHFGPLNETEAGKPPIILSGFPVKLYHTDPLQILVKRECMQDIGWDCDHGYISDGYTLEALGKKYKAVKVDELLGWHL
jgi:hypothetical protein